MNLRLKHSASAQEKASVERVKHVLSKREIEITKGDYSKQPWGTIFFAIEQSNAFRLSTYSNDAAIELKLVLSPRFPHLQELILSCNRIVSIESLVRLDAPLLQDINLLSNQITNIRSLVKAYFPRLRQINISNNPIQDPSALAYLPSKQIEQVHIQRWPNLPMIGYSKRWVVKMHAPSGQLKALTMKSMRRRVQLLIDRMIEKKYPIFKTN